MKTDADTFADAVAAEPFVPDWLAAVPLMLAIAAAVVGLLAWLAGGRA